VTSRDTPATTAQPRTRMQRWRAAILIQVLLGVLVLGVFLWRVDILGALRNLPELQLRFAIAGTITFSLSKFVHAYRWRWFLRHRDEIPFRRLFELFLVSNLANAMIPLRAGDLLRVELPNRRYGVPRAELASSVFLVESLLDGVSFVLLGFGGLLLFDLPASLRPGVAVLAAIVFVIAVVSIRAARRGETWSVDGAVWRRLVPARARPRINEWLGQWVTGMTALSDWRSASVSVLLSLLAWILEVGVWWYMGKAFGIQLAFSEALAVMIAANLAQAIPITPWSIGPYEVAVTEILVLLGASRLDGSSYAIGSRLLLMTWIGITGILAMWSLDLRPRDLIGYRNRDATDSNTTDAAATPAGEAAGDG
jgi:uncharacterized protein (TIRG00374 family)